MFTVERFCLAVKPVAGVRAVVLTRAKVTPLAPKDWEIMEYACTDNNKDLYDGHLQPGSLDGSGRDGTAIGTPPQPRL